MQGQSVTYTKKSKDRTEEFIVTLKMDVGDSIPEVLDRARIEAKAALKRSLDDEMLECDDDQLPF